MTRQELEEAKAQGARVSTPFGIGTLNGIGGKTTYVMFDSDDPDTIGFLREVLNEDIELVPTIRELLNR